MTLLKKNSNGKYIKDGKTFELLTGTRAQVYHGTAYKTSGDLTKKDLLQNKSGRIVSKKKYNTAKKEKRLIRYGYYTKKGHFGCVSKSGRKCTTLKHKGGASLLQPSNFPSAVGIKDNTDANTLYPTTSGGKYHKRGGMPLQPLSLSTYPDIIGSKSDPNGLGSFSQQSFLESPNNTPMDLALTKALGGRKRKGKKSRKVRGGVGIRHSLGSTDIQMRAGLGN